MLLNFIEKWISYLKLKGYSANTISNYRLSAEVFCEVLGTKSIFDINSSSIDLFESSVSRKIVGDDRKIRLRYLKGIRYFLEFCQDELDEKISIIPEVKKRALRLENELYDENRIYKGEYINKNEIRKMTSFWKNEPAGRSLITLRNCAIIAILSETGLKVGELFVLKRHDVCKGKINISGREIKLSKQAQSVIGEYLTQRRDSAEDLFVGYASYDPDKIKARPLSVREVQRIISNTAKDSGIKKTVTPQNLRNSLIINSLVEQMTTTEIKQYYGLTISNSSYQRFLPKAKELFGIDASYIDSIDAAKKLDMPYANLLNRIKSGKIKATKFRGDNYIKLSEVSRYSSTFKASGGS